MEDKFTVVDENGLEKEAEVVTAFSYNDKEYIIYNIKKDEENSSVYVSKLVKDSEGYDVLEGIEDDKEREEIHKVVDELLSKV